MKSAFCQDNVLSPIIGMFFKTAKEKKNQLKTNGADLFFAAFKKKNGQAYSISNWLHLIYRWTFLAGQFFADSNYGHSVS